LTSATAARAEKLLLTLLAELLSAVPTLVGGEEETKEPRKELRPECDGCGEKLRGGRGAGSMRSDRGRLRRDPTGASMGTGTTALGSDLPVKTGIWLGGGGSATDADRERLLS
jgi:hypothetical protein